MTSPLRRLDDRWVPAAAARLRRWLHRGRAGAGRGPAALLTAAVDDQPALAGSIGAVLAAAVLIGAFGPGRPSDGEATPVPTAPPALVAVVGPQPGAAVAGYLTHAAADLRHLADTAAGRETYAVVDFRDYRTPAQTTALLTGVEVVRAYVRVRSHLPTQVHSVPLRDLAQLTSGLATVAQVSTATAKSYASLLATFQPHNRSDRQARRRYVAAHRAALLDAARYAHPERCRCVFAAVVHADVATLQRLAGLPAVRAVDPAPPPVPLTGLTVRPLEPDVTTVVPSTSFTGG